MFTQTIDNITLTMDNSSEVFSPDHFDTGTLAMLSTIEFNSDDYVLDLGCGSGVVGIFVAKKIGQEKIVMADILDEAIDTTNRNILLNELCNITVVKSNGFKDIPQTGFTKILSNPPYHTDFSVAKEFIEKGFNRLTIGGKMYMVTKRKDWYKNKLISIFGGVKIDEIDGYFIFCAEKRSGSYANTKKKKVKK